MVDQTATMAFRPSSPASDHGSENEISGLDALQSSQRRRVLDMVDELRKCGLDNDISLPQIVVCGDQSAGKSSVLEALTEINFPRADNTCTLFATEIILRRAPSEDVSVKILPDPRRPPIEQQCIRGFSQSISDFSQLTRELSAIIEQGKVCMGIRDDDGTDSDDEEGPTFARDVLRIEIQGPNRPQLTVVDLPGLIQNENRHGEKEMLDDLTKQYLEQPRTICLPVITATNDADNQRILTFVKEADPAGDRSLGIITKPDTLPAGSGSEKAFISLANNEMRKYNFKLGWHVLKNRGHTERDVSFVARNKIEAEFFRRSNFKRLPAESLGIQNLGGRLSQILLDHIKKELPEICTEVANMLADTRRRSQALGPSRAGIGECRAYLINMSTRIQEICRCAVNGHYEHEFFKTREVLGFKRSSGWAIRRLRALVQQMSGDFASSMRRSGHTLDFEVDSEQHREHLTDFASDEALEAIQGDSDEPIEVSYLIAATWAHKIIAQSHGKELQGNFNPLVISELFWFQSSRWGSIAEDFMSEVADVCSEFFFDLLSQECPQDVAENINNQLLEAALQKRKDDASGSLSKIMRNYRDHPINHDVRYVETVERLQNRRRKAYVRDAMENATTTRNVHDGTGWGDIKEVDTDQAEAAVSEREIRFTSCEQAVDCMSAIYKVKLEVFVDIVLTLVVEEHILFNLENVISPTMMSRLTDEEVEKMAAEPATIRREREFYKIQGEKLEKAQKILKGVISATRR